MSDQVNPSAQLLENFPIRESAFYSQIKASTETGDASSFALIMSMLTTDAQELDEFNLPQNDPTKIKDDLYHQFHIRQQALTGQFNADRSVKHNQLVSAGQKDSVHLDLAMQPEPLLEAQAKLPKEVIDNIELNVQSRLYQQDPSLMVNEQKQAEKPDVKVEGKQASVNEIDVEAWFDVLHQSRTLSVAA